MLHTPFGPVHCAFVLHWTHRLAVVSQTGFWFLQSVALEPEHSTHAPSFAPAVKQAGAIAVVHAAGVAAPRSPSHFTHVPAALQIGVVPLHWALEPHCTQVWLVSLHAGVAPTHSTGSCVVHATHLPVSGPAKTHAGLAADLQAAGVPERRSPSQATQAPALQLGVAPPHAASVKHATHVFVAGSHDGVAPPHWLESRHWTQRGGTARVLHFGVAGVSRQFVSSTQPAVQRFVPRSQMPRTLPTHWTFEVH